MVATKKVTLKNFPKEKWLETFAKSNLRHNDETMSLRSLRERCSEMDGDPCRFLRAKVVMGSLFLGYVCLFDKCIKRYPRDEELEKMK